MHCEPTSTADRVTITVNKSNAKQCNAMEWNVSHKPPAPLARATMSLARNVDLQTVE
jgi:hypothetical protein